MVAVLVTNYQAARTVKIETLLPALLVPSLMTYALVFSPRQAVRKAYRKNPSLQQQLTAQIDNDGVDVTSEVSQSKRLWTGFTGYCETKNVWLLYQTTLSFLVIPKAAFSSEQLDAFRTLVRAKLQPLK